jgi:hypothetical protein
VSLGTNYSRGMPASRSAERQSYLVESYWPGVTASRWKASARRARHAAAALRAQGSDIEIETLLLISQDEVAFFLFNADSPDSVAEACRRASLTCDRILPVLRLDRILR